MNQPTKSTIHEITRDLTKEKEKGDPRAALNLTALAKT